MAIVFVSFFGILSIFVPDIVNGQLRQQVGLCCFEGKLMPNRVTPDQRHKSDGRPLADGPDAQKTCASLATCCCCTADFTTVLCHAKKDGTCYKTKEEAANKCRCFCCRDNKITVTTQENCKGGTCYQTQDGAMNYCLQYICCMGGQPGHDMSLYECKMGHGLSYPTVDQAKRAGCRLAP